jgi:hypothetical protein
MHIETIEVKAFRTFLVHSLFESEQLRANIALTIHKGLFRFLVTYAHVGMCDTHPVNWHRSAYKAGPSTLQAVLHGVHRSMICTWLYNVLTNMTLLENYARGKQKSYKRMKTYVRDTGQGHAWHRKYEAHWNSSMQPFKWLHLQHELSRRRLNQSAVRSLDLRDLAYILYTILCCFNIIEC